MSKFSDRYGSQRKPIPLNTTAKTLRIGQNYNMVGIGNHTLPAPTEEGKFINVSCMVAGEGSSITVSDTSTQTLIYKSSESKTFIDTVLILDVSKTKDVRFVSTGTSWEIKII